MKSELVDLARMHPILLRISRKELIKEYEKLKGEKTKQKYKVLGWKGDCLNFAIALNAILGNVCNYYGRTWNGDDAPDHFLLEFEGYLMDVDGIHEVVEHEKFRIGKAMILDLKTEKMRDIDPMIDGDQERIAFLKQWLKGFDR